MRYSDIVQILGIPHSALVSVVFGMMLVSFPLGAYVVFHADPAGHITHQMPISQLDAAGMVSVPVPQVELGDVFVAVWCAYVMLFALGMLGPGKNMLSALRDSISGNISTSNYLVQAISWFGVLVMASVIIDLLQGYVDLSLTPPSADSNLAQFYMITISPLVEEPVFRVILVGVPVFAIYTHRMSLSFLARALWHPARFLHVYDKKRMIAVVLAGGIVFGVAHVISGDHWGVDKLVQASVAGVILGYVYCKYGLACSIILHWSTNYFLYSYGNFVAYVGEWSVLDAFRHPYFEVVQAILVAIGVVTIAGKLIQRLIPASP